MTEFIIVLAVAIIIFIVCRELVCWYWKINEHLENQRKIIEKLDNLDKLYKLDDIERLLTYINNNTKNTMKKD